MAKKDKPDFKLHAEVSDVLRRASVAAKDREGAQEREQNYQAEFLIAATHQLTGECNTRHLQSDAYGDLIVKRGAFVWKVDVDVESHCKALPLVDNDLYDSFREACAFEYQGFTKNERGDSAVISRWIARGVDFGLFRRETDVKSQADLDAEFIAKQSKTLHKPKTKNTGKIAEVHFRLRALVEFWPTIADYAESLLRDKITQDARAAVAESHKVRDARDESVRTDAIEAYKASLPAYLREAIDAQDSAEAIVADLGDQDDTPAKRRRRA
jgi:hypothetical protein